MTARFLFIAAAFSFLVFWPAFLFANEAPVKSVGKTIQPLSDVPVRMVNEAPVKSVGKTIQPLSDVPVRMVAENVKITLGAGTAAVACLFTLHNEGKPGVIEVGFPRGWEGDLMNFTARNTQNQQKYPVRTLARDPSYNEITGGKLPWWKVFKATFDSTGQDIFIENTYRSNLIISAGKYPCSTNDLMFTYIMKTGALWKGNIEDAWITIHLDHVPFERVTSISPDGYAREGNSIIWRFRDFKPSEDISITIMQDAIYERMKAARKILKDNPDNAYAHYLLGSSYFSRRNMGGEQAERAEKEARKAISLDPELWDAHWLLTMSHIKNNVFKKRDLKEVKNLLVPIQQGNPGYRCADKMIYYHEYASDCTPKNLIKFLEANHWK